jgi:hypothetical protein
LIDGRRLEVHITRTFKLEDAAEAQQALRALNDHYFGNLAPVLSDWKDNAVVLSVSAGPFCRFISAFLSNESVSPPPARSPQQHGMNGINYLG